jgi:dihydrofolate reductase
MSTTPEPRHLILHMSVSLDGFVARRPGEIDWLQPDGEPFAACGAARHTANLELIGRTGQIVLGRGAYDEMGPAWSGSDSPMARLINSLPKLVFTSSQPGFEWSNSRDTPNPVEEEIPALKAEPGGDLICFGGGRFANSLIRHDLVDDYFLTVHPVALGDGLSLWQGLPHPHRLAVISATTYADGSVVYQMTASTTVSEQR